VRFEEFDFSYYNRTPFTGLENDLANCYTNALLQASAFAACLHVGGVDMASGVRTSCDSDHLTQPNKSWV